MPRIQVWVVTLMLTLIGIVLVVVLHALTIRFLARTIGNGTYVVLLVIAAAAGVFIGRIVRWLNRA